MPSLAGKIVHFKVTVNMGSKTKLCPLDDSLALKMGKNNFSELKELVHAAAMSRKVLTDKASLNESITNHLVHNNNFSVPNWLTLSEAKYLVHNAKMNWDTMPDLDKEKYLEVAENNVKLSLILDKVRELEPEAQLTDQEVFEVIKQNLAKTTRIEDIDNKIKEMNKSGYISILFSRIKDEYALDFIAKNVKLID